MKRILLVFLAFVMLLSLCSCGNDDTQATEPSQTTTNSTQQTTDITEGTTEATQVATDEPTTAPTDEATTPPSQAPTEAPTTPPTTQPTACSHSWKDATCTAPKTCSKCNATEGNAMGHNWKDATCSAPKTCSKCGVTEGSATGHSWKDATCTTAKMCTTCNKTEGSAAGHMWGAWTTVIAAEIGKAGQEKHTCSSCMQSEAREIPALQEDYTKKWFVAQYDIAKQQYLHSLEKSLTEKENQIADLRESASALYVSYMQEVKNIKERYPNSATRDVMLQNAKDNYNHSAQIYTEKIDVLENDITAIEAEISNPNVDNILTIVTQNCNISSKETYEYYYKYADSLS